jgi:3-oxoacyl-[acyl-carrier-protein] synthase III
MRVWLELNKDEAEGIFGFIASNFNVEGRKTVVLGTPDEQAKDQVVKQVGPQAAEQVVQAMGQVNEQVVQVNDQVTKQVTKQVTEQVNEQVNGQVNEQVVQTTPVITLEQVRAVLQAKRLGGKGTEVATLVKSYGVNSLPEIPQEYYPEIMEKAEVM